MRRTQRSDNRPSNIDRTAILGRDCEIDPAATVDYGVKIGANAIVGPKCVILEGSEIGDNSGLGYFTITEQSVTIDEGVTCMGLTSIRRRAKIGANTVIGMFCEIGKNAEIGPNSVIDEGTIIEADTKIPPGSHVHVDGSITLL